MTDPHPLGAAALSEYTTEQQRVCAYLQQIAPDIGCGLDPIGFLIASHAEHSRRPTAPSQEGEKPVAWEFNAIAEAFRKGAMAALGCNRWDDADDFFSLVGMDYAAGRPFPSTMPKPRPAKPVDGEVVERLRAYAAELERGLQCNRPVVMLRMYGNLPDGVSYNSRLAADLRALVAALPLGGEDMADLSKTDRLSGSPIPNDGWCDLANLPKVKDRTVHINVRSTTTYRWLPYKADGRRQMHAAGRWQIAKEHGGFENAPLPYGGEWQFTDKAQGTTPPPSADKSGAA